MNRLWQMLKSTIPFFLKRFPYQALNSICFSSEALRLSHFFFFNSQSTPELIVPEGKKTALRVLRR